MLTFSLDLVGEVEILAINAVTYCSEKIIGPTSFNLVWPVLDCGVHENCLRRNQGGCNEEKDAHVVRGSVRGIDLPP